MAVVLTSAAPEQDVRGREALELLVAVAEGGVHPGSRGVVQDLDQGEPRGVTAQVQPLQDLRLVALHVQDEQIESRRVASSSTEVSVLPGTSTS